MGGLVDLSLSLIVRRNLPCLFLLTLTRNLKTTVLIFQFPDCYLFKKMKFLVMKIRLWTCLDNNVKLDSVTSRPCWIIPGEWFTLLLILSVEYYSLCQVLSLHILKNTEPWEHTASRILVPYPDEEHPVLCTPHPTYPTPCLECSTLNVSFKEWARHWIKNRIQKRNNNIPNDVYVPCITLPYKSVYHHSRMVHTQVISNLVLSHTAVVHWVPGPPAPCPSLLQVALTTSSSERGSRSWWSVLHCTWQTCFTLVCKHWLRKSTYEYVHNSGHWKWYVQKALRLN